MLGHPAKFRRRFKQPELRQVHRIWAQEGARLEMEGYCRPCDTRMFVISDKDACLQVVNKFDIWTNCEKNWCSDSDADCCSRWGRCGAVSEPPCGWWQIRLGTHCLSRTSELSSHCWGVVNALNTDHFRSVASVFDILLISRIWFAPHLKLLPDVNLLKIKRIRSQIVWTVDCRLHIQIRAGLSPASIYRPYSPLSPCDPSHILVALLGRHLAPLWSSTFNFQRRNSWHEAVSSILKQHSVTKQWYYNDHPGTLGPVFSRHDAATLLRIAQCFTTLRLRSSNSLLTISWKPSMCMLQRFLRQRPCLETSYFGMFFKFSVFPLPWTRHSLSAPLQRPWRHS